ncbi:glutamic acid-rich protein [Xenopus laevis]|uniref:Glutamic acid-rich protein n=2 Tax=Xenopus laevis TaxID=8355 RepID=A0A1L8H8V5_XENLA|nr:glutamic acid-rich protein [Xenopus laevis]OCT92476.1 hypothetical protein XELAEV_18015531mg [Xenopus laevis]
MHRSYQPILPCGNKYLQQKWDKTYYDEHKIKVQSAKPMVDTNSPHTYVHLNQKLKKLKLEEERLAVIERDNHLLLQKMSTIMKTKGRVDNKNEYETKSLNKEKRDRELLRVSRENQTILDRITKCEPQYQVEKWQEDWVKAEKYMDSIARYPRGWWCLTHQEKSEFREKKKSTKRADSSESLVREIKTKKENVKEERASVVDKDKKKKMVSIKEVGVKSRETKVNQGKATKEAKEIHKQEPKNYTKEDDLGGDREGYEDSADEEQEHAADERADESDSDAKSESNKSAHSRVQKEDEEKTEGSGDEENSDTE